jgi:hypothetical protein
MFYRAQNECHEIDDEKATSVVGNLSRDPALLRRNPYYNKKLLPTSHAAYLDPETLFKLGQLTKEQCKEQSEQ